ncbi:MAG TPA: SRPBCC domain-containing protein [Polyangiaceae bacterium]|nr:SRPBCC domain-containing protein [Polyangiaceae bacterium]
MKPEGEMTPEHSVSVRVTHRFSASAERVFDAWLDPSKACKFLFATATGQIVRTEIDARVGGGFTIVDRRNGEDVAHVGTYVAIERPRRLVFELSVPKYSADSSRVSIDIQPLDKGCELTLVQHMAPRYAEYKARTGDGWRRILQVLEELVPLAEPSCGAGLAQHATIPAKVAPLFAALADTLETHRALIVLGGADARREDDAYRELAAGYRELARSVEQVAAMMASHRDLPPCPHDESAFGAAQLQAFQRFVKAQSELLELLRPAAERDEAMLASMQRSG